MSDWLNQEQEAKLHALNDATVGFLESMGKQLTQDEKEQLKQGLFKESEIEIKADGGACIKSIGPMVIEADISGCK